MKHAMRRSLPGTLYRKCLLPVLLSGAMGMAATATHAHADTEATAPPTRFNFNRTPHANPEFLVARPLLQRQRHGLRIGLEYTLRLPSGAIATRAPGWLAEVHAAANLAGTNSVPGFSVPSLQASWHSRRQHWRLSLRVTDLARENLFTNLTDLSTIEANRLQQWPDRHWWFGVERRF